MKTLATAGLFAAATLLGVPAAAADPDILLPYCSEGQVPTTGECKPAPDRAYVNDAPGANPDVAVGLDPESVPAI